MLFPLTVRRPTPESNDAHRSRHRRLPASNPGLSLGSGSWGEHQRSVDEYRRLQPYDWLKVRVMKINLASLQMHDYGVPNFVPAYRVLFTDKGAPTKAESMCRGSREAICKKGKSTDIPAILEARLSG